jgi:SAM-dependent methyltransferase
MDPLRRALFASHRRVVHLPRVRRVSRALAELVGAAESLLDVGAGDGAIAARVAEHCGATRVMGVDVAPRAPCAIPTQAYDGHTLPFDDGAFEAVLVADVLHHAEDPTRVLAECLRVARRVVAVKDHYQFGWSSNQLLLWMDHVGNAEAGVHVRGRYFTRASFAETVAEAGGRVVRETWPLRIHHLPFRLVTRDELQFAAAVEPVRR